MKNNIIGKFTSNLLIAAITCGLLLISNDTMAQSLWKINQQNPGGGTNTTYSDQKPNPTTAIFVITGILVGGYVLYKYVLNPKEDKDTTSSEGTASVLIPKNSKFHTEMESLAEAQKSEPPVNVYLGVSRDYYVNREKTYILGVSFNF